VRQPSATRRRDLKCRELASAPTPCCQ
jgi:hypothetical protein